MGGGAVFRKTATVSHFRQKLRPKKKQKKQSHGGNGRERVMACYHGVQRKKSCLQPIYQLPATKLCLSNSLFSSTPPPPFFLSVFVISCKNDGVDILWAENTSVINLSVQYFFILLFRHTVVHVWVCAHLLQCPYVCVCVCAIENVLSEFNLQKDCGGRCWKRFAKNK